MKIRDIQDLKHFVTELSDKLAAKDRFFTARLAVRLARAAQEHPQDHTVVQMASFLDSRSQKPGGHFITRSELENVYNKLYTANTKCAAYLTEELNKKAHNLPEPAKMSRSAREGETIDDMYSRHADQTLVAQLESVFDKNASYITYDKKLAVKAERIVASMLPGFPTVKTVDGRDYAILCEACFQTPKGKTSVLIPVETVNGNVLVPNSFLTPAGFERLTHKHILDHVKKTAGKVFKVNAGQVLDIIKTAKFGKQEDVNDVELAVIRLRAKTAADVTPEGILYQKVDEEVKSVEIPETELTRTFASKLNSVAGQAEFLFTKKAVDMGKYWIKREIEGFGYKNPQIKVANVAEDKIIYAVSVNACGFKIPVKVKDNNVSPPSVIVTAGGVESFDRIGIKNALGASDASTAALALGYDLANVNNLVTAVEESCAGGDFKKATEVLEAINATGDEKAMKYAFDVYLSSMNGENTVKQASTPNLKTVKIGGNVVEATTGLPVDKVYVDENGVVQAKHRQNNEKTDACAAAGMMNAKIIMGL